MTVQYKDGTTLWLCTVFKLYCHFFGFTAHAWRQLQLSEVPIGPNSVCHRMVSLRNISVKLIVDAIFWIAFGHYPTKSMLTLGQLKNVIWTITIKRFWPQKYCEPHDYSQDFFSRIFRLSKIDYFGICNIIWQIQRHHYYGLFCSLICNLI